MQMRVVWMAVPLMVAFAVVGLTDGTGADVGAAVQRKCTY